MIDNVFINGLVLHAYHGVMPHEGEVGQPFILDLVLDIDLADAAKSDKLADTVSYDAVVNVVTRTFTGKRYRLVNATGKRRGVLDTSWADDVVADDVLGACGPRAVFWHRDVVTRLPEGTRVLARAQTGELVAARYAPTVWGVQCHPEARIDIVTGWAAKDRALAASDAEEADVDRALAAVTSAGRELAAAWRPLAAGFAGQVRASAASRGRTPPVPVGAPGRR